MASNATSDGNPATHWFDRFHKGVAISIWQNSADDDSNWTRYAKNKWPFKCFGLSRYKGKYHIGSGCDFWNRYREDLQLSANIGCTSFRFTIEWARVEPKKGVIDMEAVKRYNDMLDVMEELNMVPNATLHHFVHPTWFDDLGGFKKEANIPHFVNWCLKALELFGSRIKMWSTFNEPTCFTFLGFLGGMMPPGRLVDMFNSGTHLSNMLKAHTAAYKAMKARPEGVDASIGLVHHHITFKPRGKGMLYSVANAMSKWMEYWWGWDVVDHWMKTGEFVWKVPVYGTWMKWKDPKGKPPCDWWGINYYSRVVLDWHLNPTCFPNEVMTDMFYPIYGEGLYEAVKRSSAYGIPMYITETGVADVKDNIRSIFIDAYVKQTLRALADGYDVRGFYYWTLIDNFEWAMGWTMKFGLYAYEPDGSVDRKLKEGSRTLVTYFKTLPDTLDEVRAKARAMQSTLGEDLGVREELETVQLLAKQDAACSM